MEDQYLYISFFRKRRILKKAFSSPLVLKICNAWESQKKKIHIFAHHDQKDNNINFSEIALYLKPSTICSTSAYGYWDCLTVPFLFQLPTCGGPSGMSDMKKVVIKDQAEAMNPGCCSILASSPASSPLSSSIPSSISRSFKNRNWTIQLLHFRALTGVKSRIALH